MIGVRVGVVLTLVVIAYEVGSIYLHWTLLLFVHCPKSCSPDYVFACLMSSFVRVRQKGHPFVLLLAHFSLLSYHTSFDGGWKLISSSVPNPHHKFLS